MHRTATTLPPLLASAVAATIVLGPCALPVLAQTEDSEEPAEVIFVTGIVRDFRGMDEPGGHPDFNRRPDNGFGRYSGNIAENIGDGLKPVFVGGGYKVSSQWRDSEHRQICHLLYDASLGDVEGSFSQPDSGSIESAESFAQWYDDEIGVCMSDTLTLALVLQPDGHYIFDDRDDPFYVELGGFFPIDDRLFGNTPGAGGHHNYHFTYELHLEFEYDASGDQFFMFVGDDDVFVFIDGKLVIDLGGVHAAHDQHVQLDRLGLEDCESYAIDFFFAERYKPQSNFRLETNIPVRSTMVPAVTAIYD